MTTPQDDGGPAFPVPPDQAYATGMSLCDGTAVCAAGTGMSLRDWFAGMALQGMFASCREDWDETDFDITAEMAYQSADAMLAARNAKR